MKNNEIKISLFGNAGCPTPSEEITLSQFAHIVKSEKYGSEISYLRSLDDENYKFEKRNLSAVCASGVCVSRDVQLDLNKKFVEHSGLLQCDFDASDNQNITDELFNKLCEDKHVVIAFKSPRGNGLKLFAKIKPSLEHHFGSFLTAETYFREKYNLAIDKATKDPLRLCFVSADKNLFEREYEDAIAFEPMKTKRRVKTLFTPTSASDSDVVDVLQFISPAPCYEDWFAIVSAVKNVVRDDHRAEQILSSWSPEYKSGEYANKLKHAGTKFNFGTLVYYARRDGGGRYDAARIAKKAVWGGRMHFGGNEISDEVAEKRVEDVIEEKIETPKTENEFKKLVKQASENHIGSAEAFAEEMKGKLLFDHKLEMWRRYENGVWKLDDTAQTKVKISKILKEKWKKLIKEMEKEAEDGKIDAENVKNVEKIAEIAIKNANNQKFLKSVEDLARSLLPAKPELFDVKPMLIACENGVIDLETCDFRDFRESDMLTKQLKVEYNSTATCEHWTQFVSDIFENDAEMVKFAQRMVGYCLSGSCNENCLFFWFGDGANGKSIFRSALEMLLGEYRTEISVAALLSTMSNANIDYQKARLKGARIAFTDEIPTNKHFDAGQIKAMTGSDTILARNPFEKPYSFTPTHKLVLIGNDKPVVKETDTGTWRRINIVPFNRCFKKEEQIPASTFYKWWDEEMSGILNWALQGWADYQKHGLCVPEKIKNATKKYREENDQLGRMIATKLVEDSTGTIKLTDFFKAYKDFCAEEGETPNIMNTRQVRERLEQRGFVLKYNNYGKRWYIYNYYISE